LIRSLVDELIDIDLVDHEIIYYFCRSIITHKLFYRIICFEGVIFFKLNFLFLLFIAVDFFDRRVESPTLHQTHSCFSTLRSPLLNIFAPLARSSLFPGGLLIKQTRKLNSLKFSLLDQLSRSLIYLLLQPLYLLLTIILYLF